MITSSVKTLQVVCCASCQEPLPDQQYWKGRILICDKEACYAAAKNHGCGLNKFVPANTIKCAWFDCNNHVPEGFYLPQARELSCSAECYQKLKNHPDWLVCMHCSRTYRGRKQRKLNFCCKAHSYQYFVELRLARTGTFGKVFSEYLDLFANGRRRTMVTQRMALVLFGEFLTEKGFTNLEDVTPQTISEFIAWGLKAGKNSVWAAVWPISSMMKWLLVTGKRKAANPVIPRFHSRPTSKRLPRPFSEEEMQLIDSLLKKRGTPQVKLAVAIAEESGLRIGELCNLRVQDIDLKRMALFVRLPNKTMKEAWVPFHEKTRERASEWLRERDLTISHDYLLYNEHGRPYTRCTLHNAIAAVLVKSLRGRKYNEDGLDSWSTHRLRHTMATRLVAAGADAATVMTVGRWDSFENMCAYARVDPAVAARGYNEAMHRAKATVNSPLRRSSGFLQYVKKTTPEK